jgi:hypothetical protein
MVDTFNTTSLSRSQLDGIATSKQRNLWESKSKTHCYCSEANGQWAGCRETNLDSGRGRTLFLTSLLIELIDHLFETTKCPIASKKDSGVRSFLQKRIHEHISSVHLPGVLSAAAGIRLVTLVEVGDSRILDNRSSCRHILGYRSVLQFSTFASWEQVELGSS